jgi:hypothetical protein
MLGPAITGEPASTANDFAAASLYKSLHWLGDHACEKTASLHAEIWSPVDHATLCDSAWDGSPQGKDLPARHRVRPATRNIRPELSRSTVVGSRNSK